MQRRITDGSSLADTTTTGTLGYCARRYIRPEKPRTPGIDEVEQDQVDIAAGVEQLGHLLEGAGFRDFDMLEQPADGFAQGAAKQRMIVGNDEAIVGLVSQRVTRRIAPLVIGQYGHFTTFSVVARHRPSRFGAVS